MDATATALLSESRKPPKQSEFITELGALVREGSSADLQEAALQFWSQYPQVSLTFARRIVSALERLEIPARRFEASLLMILARCYLRCGRTEQAGEYIVAARRIMPVDAPHAFVQQAEELEVTIWLACSELAAAQYAYQRMRDYSQRTCGGLSCAQSLIGARLSFALGDLPQAIRRARRAVERAVTDEQRCQAQLVVLHLEGYVRGDIREELIQLVALEHTQNRKDHALFSAPVRSRLLSQLSCAFICQGKLDQAAHRLGKVAAHSAEVFCSPELLAAALETAKDHPTEARRHIKRFERRSTVGLSQAEHLDRRFVILLLYQMLDGAKPGLDDAEELYQLCELTQHLWLYQRACVLFASALIAAEELSRARQVLEESGLDRAQHKTLHLLYLCLRALCATDETRVISEDMKGLLADEDSAYIVLFLAQVHPAFIELLLAQDLEGSLAPSTQQLVHAHVAYIRRKRQSTIQVTHGAPVCSSSGASAFVEDAVLDADRALRIQLFGSLQVRRRGVRLDLERLRRKKVRSLIITLALARGREVSRDALMAEMWPCKEQPCSLNSFYVVWNALRKVFQPEGPRLTAREFAPEWFPFSNAGGRYSLLTEYCSLDINDFDRLVLRISDAIHRGMLDQSLQFTDELLVVYQDKLLPADLDNENLKQARLFYQQAFVETIMLVARKLLLRRDTARAIPFIERGLAADRSCEELYRLAIHAYALEGRRGDSVRMYYQCRKNLKRDLGIEPSQKLTDLFIRLLSLPAKADYSVTEVRKHLGTAAELESRAASAA